jgi:tetratricopeptide (TPR) repeat protein
MSPRKIKYHPDVDLNKDSLITWQAYIDQIKQLQKNNNQLSENIKHIVEKLQDTLCPSAEFKKALGELQRSLKPSEEYKHTVEKLQETLRPSAEFKKALEELQRSLKPSEEYKHTVEKLQETLRPSQEHKKAIEELQRSLKQTEEYRNNLVHAMNLWNMFKRHD